MNDIKELKDANGLNSKSHNNIVIFNVPEPEANILPAEKLENDNVIVTQILKILVPMWNY